MTNAPSDSSSVDYETRRRALADRVLALGVKGVIGGAFIEDARRADQILAVDFFENRVELALHGRGRVAQLIPADCGDEILAQVRQGQPALQPGERTATWCIATEWNGSKPALEIHLRLRGLIVPQGTA